MSAFESAATGLFGKTRSQAEFVRAHAADPALAAFDAWLGESVEWALGHAGPAFPEAFSRGGIHAFALQPRSASEERLIAGVLAPSEDSAGRKYPLVVAAPTRVADSLLSAPGLLPFVLETFWASSSELLGRLLAEQPPDLHAAVAGLRAHSDLEVEEARSLYTEWAEGLPLNELWTLLGSPLEEPEPSLRLLWLAGEPLRGTDRPETRLSFRFPLGRAGGVALCFWIDLVSRVLGWRRTLPSFFWSHDGVSGSALVNLGRPPRATVAELFLPSETCDEICDLSARVKPSTLATLPALGPALASVLAKRDARVADLLGAAGGGAAAD